MRPPLHPEEIRRKAGDRQRVFARINQGDFFLFFAGAALWFPQLLSATWTQTETTDVSMGAWVGGHGGGRTLSGPHTMRAYARDAERAGVTRRLGGASLCAAESSRA